MSRNILCKYWFENMLIEIWLCFILCSTTTIHSFDLKRRLNCAWYMYDMIYDIRYMIYSNYGNNGACEYIVPSKYIHHYMFTCLKRRRKKLSCNHDSLFQEEEHIQRKIPEPILSASANLQHLFYCFKVKMTRSNDCFFFTDTMNQDIHDLE